MYTLTDKNFTDHLQHEDSLMVNFSADWCGSCVAISPLINQIDQENSNLVQIAKVDVDESPITAASYNIRSIPSFLFFKKGILVDTVVGPVSKSLLEKKLQNLTEL